MGFISCVVYVAYEISTKPNETANVIFETAQTKINGEQVTYDKNSGIFKDRNGNEFKIEISSKH